MTSFAAIAAVPPALGIGPGAETRRPMALVVPCAYSLSSGLESGRHEKALRLALIEMGERQDPAGK